MTTTECYDTWQLAKVNCMAVQDCHAITTQSNVCGGKYRVSHGGPTLIYYSDGGSFNLRSWVHSCKGNKYYIEIRMY